MDCNMMNYSSGVRGNTCWFFNKLLKIDYLIDTADVF